MRRPEMIPPVPPNRCGHPGLYKVIHLPSTIYHLPSAIYHLPQYRELHRSRLCDILGYNTVLGHPAAAFKPLFLSVPDDGRRRTVQCQQS